MLIDSYPANQVQSCFPSLLSSSLVTQLPYSKDFKFINASSSNNESSDDDLPKTTDEKCFFCFKNYAFKGDPLLLGQKDFYPNEDPEIARERHLLHSIVYTFQLLHLVFPNIVNPARRSMSDGLGMHRNTFDKYKKRLQDMGYLDWKSGKKTWETNKYSLDTSLVQQIIPRPESYKMPTFLRKAIYARIKEGDWAIKKKFYTRLVHQKNISFSKERAFEEKNEINSSKDPPKTRAGPRRPIFRQLLKPFNLNFRDQAILSSYGEAPLRAAINDLESYSGKVFNTVAFLISRCKAIKSKLQDMAKELTATPEENLNWLKEHLSSDAIKKRCKFFTKPDEINRATKSKTPYIRLMIHKHSPEKSKLIIEQKVNGHWIDKVIELFREKFRTAVMTTLEMAFKHSDAPTPSF